MVDCSLSDLSYNIYICNDHTALPIYEDTVIKHTDTVWLFYDIDKLDFISGPVPVGESQSWTDKECRRCESDISEATRTVKSTMELQRLVCNFSYSSNKLFSKYK